MYSSALCIPDCISTSPTKGDSCVFLQHVRLLWHSKPEIKLLQRFTSFSVLSSSFYPQQSTASSKKLLCETRAFPFLRCLSLHALTTNAVRQTRRETAGHTARPLVLTAQMLTHHERCSSVLQWLGRLKGRGVGYPKP